MTCEVAVANRLGIALAADSAATFTQSGTGARTYATGANKIFQLADFDPVGCMIFNNSSLAGIPWELLIKAYRGQQRASLATIQAYCDDFHDFVAGNRSVGLLPDSVRELSGQTALFLAMNRVTQRLLATVTTLQNDQALDVKEAVQRALHLANEHTNASPIFPALSAEDMAKTAAEHKEELVVALTSLLKGAEFTPLRDHVAVVDLVDLVVRALFRTPVDMLSTAYTGIVIAGFGEEQFLPSCVSVKVYGFIAGKLILEPGDSFAMDHTGRDCYITPFATRTMVETFMLGASSNVYSFVHQHFIEAAQSACTASLAMHEIAHDADKVRTAVDQSLKGFMEGWIGDVSKAHLLPLLKIVGGLSLEELGELADTLVMLESLKEKVTYRTQSVGGPVDVALITKADGLVWIKRKLYFDASLNHRYLARVERKHRGER